MNATTQSPEKTSNPGILLAMTTPSAAPDGMAAAAAPAPAKKAKSSEHSWTGVYIGGNIGGANGNADTSVNPLPSATTFVNLLPTTLKPSPSGVVFGGQIGFNWQTGRWVLGTEFSFGSANIDGTKAITPIIQNNGTPFPGVPTSPGNNGITVHEDVSSIGTLAPRVGYAVYPRLLVYGTGGLAFGHASYFANTDFRPVGTEQYPAFLKKGKQGWVGGGGVEYAFQGRWSVRGQYLAYELGDESIVANPVPPLPPFGIAYKWNTSGQMYNFGLNFKF
ncbi:MAG TPA: outer membrane beta-barrel protein [Alphaproteobacteria bacterium]|nr:outer membrane beta-barrel protein [Alphaproteobacteria bacterium]